MRSRVPAVVPLFLSILILLFGSTERSSAQIPDKFTNLRILPKTTSKETLVSTMRQFSLALGVRCGHCHALADSTKSSEFNFASDAKREKRIARTMMTMVSTINTTLVPKSGIKSPARVKCVTCHHGVRKPETLTDAMKSTVETSGLGPAQQQYRELRAKYYGTGAYDFSPRSLQDLAEWLVRDRGDADGAIAVLNLGLEYDPQDADAYGMLGMIQASKGDKLAAIESVKKALELDPENRPAQQLLKKLESGE